MPPPTEKSPPLPTFWSLPATDLLASLRSTPTGLTGTDAASRLAKSGAAARPDSGAGGTLMLLASQFRSPIILLLLSAVVLSFFLHDTTNAFTILLIVLASGLLGFWQEQGAAGAVKKLLAVIQTRSTILRDGKPTPVESAQIVPGDVSRLAAGDVIPGDSLLLESKDLFVNEATLTGETFPVEKTVGVLAPETPLGGRSNALFAGTYVTSGTATALIVRTGKDTEFGKVSETLKSRPPETEFERGIRQFGNLLMQVTLVLVVAIFAVNVYLHRPVLESFLFSLALAVGLTPQLLPAIISVNLAHGARRMAAARVIVKRLAAIENFGSMDILCSDKTGTLTEGEVRLQSALNIAGEAGEKTLLYAQLNASFQTGYANPLDKAILAYRAAELSAYAKRDEEPYDFVRKRLSVLVERDGACLMVTKGAFANILAVCATAETPTGAVTPLADCAGAIQKQFESFSGQGFRAVGVAYRDLETQTGITKEDEKGMTFLGFLLFYDPVKEGMTETIQRLRRLGITLKLVTGDNRLVAAHVGRAVGLSTENILAGPDMRDMSEAVLRERVVGAEIFAEIEPNQKESVIIALQKAGHVVGHMGDGINDAPALHAADVGISVANAVDVAREAADIVLLDQDLAVLEQGVREGRITFANTLKYVFMATSANFGNMFSMAGASLFLPFLPLLPTQVLLTNLFSDLPEMTIATDSVDAEQVDKPRRWDIGFIRRFMLVFGLANSACDYLTFGVLLFFLHATPTQFRTGWFIENVVTAALIVLVVRTRKPFYKSRPGKWLLAATLGTVAATIALPYSPLAHVWHFSTISPLFLLALAAIMVFYVVVAEVAKFFFYRHEAVTAATHPKI